MPIYPIREKVDYYNTITTLSGYTRSYHGGNLFESLASTNPELFNAEKLKQIERSKNIVADFNNYFIDIMAAEIDRYGKVGANIDRETPEGNDLFSREFNLSFHTLVSPEIKWLIDNGYKNWYFMIVENYVPEGLSEEGIKRLIKLRTANNALMVRALTKMLEDNSTLLNITTLEAEHLIKDLADGNKSYDAIANIRDKLKDPNVLKKFKVGDNYDFRSIGGAYLFLAHGIENEGGHPAKYLSYIFKYDAIVIAHGDYTPRERSVVGASLSSNNWIVYRLMTAISECKPPDSLKEKYGPLIAHSKRVYDKLAKYAKKFIIPKDELSVIGKEIVGLLNDIDANMKKHPEEEALVMYFNRLDFVYQNIYVKQNMKDVMRDGKSNRWTTMNVSTMTKKNLNHGIDIIRTLKKEGFKNVMMVVCNPGSIQLPADIKLDPNFKVTMGKHSVLKENSIYTEGVLDNVNDLIRNIGTYFKNTIHSCGKIYNEITAKCKALYKRLRKAFRGTANINIIEFDGKKPIFTSVQCTDYAQVEAIVDRANKSIRKEIDRVITDHDAFMKNATERLKELEE